MVSSRVYVICVQHLGVPRVCVFAFVVTCQPVVVLSSSCLILVIITFYSFILSFLSIY